MDEIEILRKKLGRERQARKQAEQILEKKAIELYNVNQKLKEVNEHLENEIENKTKAFIAKEKQYRSLVESANDIIYNISIDGFFTYVNNVGVKILGVPKEQIVGQYFVDLIRKDYKKVSKDFYNNVIDQNIQDSYFEFPMETEDGEIIWLGQTAKPMIDDNGAPYFSVIARDITEKKIVEQELLKIKKQVEASEVKYRSIIENMELGLLEVDNDGKVTKAYPLFCEMTGYTEEELMGRDPATFMLNESSRQVIDQQHFDRTEGRAGVYEIKIKRKNGEEIWVLISGAPFYDINGNILGTIGIHYDISPIKRLQEDLIKAREIAERAQLAQKQFIATMSHEIRTPLNAIIGMSHLLQESKLNTEQNELVNLVINASNILKALISDILDLSKIDSGNVEVHERPLDLQVLIKTLDNVFRSKVDSSLVNFEVIIDEKLDFEVNGDELLINQILLNLLSNAVKFTKKGKVAFTTIVKEESDNTVTIEFDVTDSGIGIDEKHIENIFDPFKQANRKIQEEYGGTGLGLSITKKLINLLGGEINVKSKPGKGTRFWFVLTFTKTGRRLEEQAVKNKTYNKLSFSHPILVVEDNQMNQKYLSKLLSKWGLEFEIANNGKEGVDRVLNNLYSIILMDLQMPVMDGLQACRIIRMSDDFRHKKIPIIALSASTLLSKKDAVEEAGMDGFLSKPFTPDQLSELLFNYSEAEPPDNTDSSPYYDFLFLRELDYAYLESLYGDDLPYATEMFETFLEMFPGEVSKLKEAITTMNFEEVYKIAHKIKPTFNMVGLSPEGLLMEQIEEAANRKTTADTCLALIEAIEKDKIPLIRSQLDALKNQQQ